MDDIFLSTSEMPLVLLSVVLQVHYDYLRVAGEIRHFKVLTDFGADYSQSIESFFHLAFVHVSDND